MGLRPLFFYIFFGFIDYSLSHCICVHQEKISAAAGLEPGTPGLSVNHATKELFYYFSLGIDMTSNVDPCTERVKYI